MNWSPLNATPAVGFSQVSKAWRGSCGSRSSRTLLHRDPASGSGGMLLSQTRGSLHFRPPPFVVPAVAFRPVFRPGLLAFPGLPGRPGVFQLPRPFAAVPACTSGWRS